LDASAEHQRSDSQPSWLTWKTAPTRLSDGDGIDEIFQKLGKIQGMFELQRSRESCPTFVKLGNMICLFAVELSDLDAKIPI